MNQLLQHLRLIFRPGEPIWLKLGEYSFFYAELDHNGGLRIHPTTGKDTERKIDRSTVYDETWLINQSKKQDGGLLYIPGKPEDLPLKGYSKGSNDLGVELDWGTREEQQARYDWLKGVSGLDPLIVFSAGKSLHGHIVLDKDIPNDQRIYLARLLCIALLGDPACAQEYQAMRLAGGFRKEKGKYQDLIERGRKHPLDEVLKGLKAAFKELGYIFPTRISDELWRLLAKVLRGDEPPNEKQEKLREILAKTDDELSPKTIVRTNSNFSSNSGLSSSVIPPLEIFLSKENQENLKGVPSHRNVIGTAVAKDLSGCAEELTRLGVPFNGDPYALFIYFCENCSGDDWREREWETIWRSATNKSCEPAIRREGIENRLFWYRYNNDPGFQTKAKAEFREQDREKKGLSNISVNSSVNNRDKDYNTARRAYTADEKISEKILPPIPFEDGKIYGIKSPLGSGKTELLKSYLKDSITQNDTVLYLGTRVTLQRQFISDANQVLDPSVGQFVHINDLESVNLDYQKKIALCIDSLMKLDDEEKLDNPILLLDEIISLWGQIMLGGTHVRHKRFEIIERFWSLINRAKLVICLDGNLTDWAMEPFAKLANKPITKIENTFLKVNNPPWQIIGGEFIEGEKLSKNDKRALIIDIIEQATELAALNKEIKETKDYNKRQELIRKRKPLVLPCDSQKFCESLDLLLRSLGLSGYRLDGKTSRNKIAKLFLANPNRWIEENQPDYLIYSNTAESGLNISINNYFKARYCFIFGTVSYNMVDSVTQLIKRVRDDLPTKIWINRAAINRKYKENTVSSHKEYIEHLDYKFNLKIGLVTADESQSDEKKSKVIEQYRKSKSYHYEFSTQMMYQALKEGAKLRESVISRMRTIGYKVETYVSYLDDDTATQISKDLSDIRTVVDLRDATEIFNAPDPEFSEHESKWISETDEEVEGDWAAKAKANIYNRFPGIWLTPAWSIELINLIRNQAPNLEREVTLETKVRNRELDSKAAKSTYKKIARTALKDIWNLNDDVGLVDSLRSIRLLELIDFGQPFKIDDELPQAILKASDSKTHKDFLEWPKVFSKKQKAWVPVSDSTRLRQLLSLLGYSLKSEREGTGDRKYLYSVMRPTPKKLIKDIVDLDALKEIRQWYLEQVVVISSSLKAKLTIRAEQSEAIEWEVPPILTKPILLSNEVLLIENEPKNIQLNFSIENDHNPYGEPIYSRPKSSETLYATSEILDVTENLFVPTSKIEIVPTPKAVDSTEYDVEIRLRGEVERLNKEAGNPRPRSSGVYDPKITPMTPTIPTTPLTKCTQEKDYDIEIEVNAVAVPLAPAGEDKISQPPIAAVPVVSEVITPPLTAAVPPAVDVAAAIPVIGARVLIEGKKLARVLQLTAKNAYDEAGAIVERLDNGLTSWWPWSLLSLYKT